MGAAIEGVAEQLLYMRTAEFTRRQADVVDDQKVYGAAGGPFVGIG
jgi:hypothetical protein